MRYIRNGIFTQEEMTKLAKSKVCIVGCGGLGGYVLEMLARVGVLQITLIDGDVFQLSNLNRQLLANEKNIGQFKVDCGKERVHLINSEVKVTVVRDYVTKENATTYLKGHDVVIDGLDNIETRFFVQTCLEQLGIPFIHGAIAGWYGQVAVVYPGDKTLEKLYGDKVYKGIEEKIGNPSFTPATIASLQVSEGLKVILGKEECLREQVLFIDLLNHDYIKMSLG